MFVYLKPKKNEIKETMMRASGFSTLAGSLCFFFSLFSCIYISQAHGSLSLTILSLSLVSLAFSPSLFERTALPNAPFSSLPKKTRNNTLFSSPSSLPVSLMRQGASLPLVPLLRTARSSLLEPEEARRGREEPSIGLGLGHRGGGGGSGARSSGSSRRRSGGGSSSRTRKRGREARGSARGSNLLASRGVGGSSSNRSSCSSSGRLGSRLLLVLAAATAAAAHGEPFDRRRERVAVAATAALLPAAALALTAVPFPHGTPLRLGRGLQPLGLGEGDGDDVADRRVRRRVDTRRARLPAVP